MLPHKKCLFALAARETWRRVLYDYTGLLDSLLSSMGQTRLESQVVHAMRARQDFDSWRLTQLD
jgi:hypothetical protein